MTAQALRAEKLRELAHLVRKAHQVAMTLEGVPRVQTSIDAFGQFAPVFAAELHRVEMEILETEVVSANFPVPPVAA
jgi:hypothetical protein